MIVKVWTGYLVGWSRKVSLGKTFQLGSDWQEGCLLGRDLNLEKHSRQRK